MSSTISFIRQPRMSTHQCRCSLSDAGTKTKRSLKPWSSYKKQLGFLFVLECRYVVGIALLALVLDCLGPTNCSPLSVKRYFAFEYSPVLCWSCVPRQPSCSDPGFTFHL